MNPVINPPTSFDTPRLHIRRAEPEDADRLYEAARSSIAEVFRFLPWCHPDYSLKEAQDWLANVRPSWDKGTEYQFGIYGKKDGDKDDDATLLGGCGITKVDAHPVGNLGYWVRSDRTGQGIASEATRALAAFGFEHLRLQRIEIMMSVENVASRSVAIICGAISEGIARNRLLLHGKAHDAYIYSLLPEDVSAGPK